MGGESGGMIGTCELQACEEGGEANKGGHMGEGLGAPGACYVDEHVVVRALGGDGPLLLLRTLGGGIVLYCIVLKKPIRLRD